MVLNSYLEPAIGLTFSQGSGRRSGVPRQIAPSESTS